MSERARHPPIAVAGGCRGAAGPRRRARTRSSGISARRRTSRTDATSTCVTPSTRMPGRCTRTPRCPCRACARGSRARYTSGCGFAAIPCVSDGVVKPVLIVGPCRDAGDAACVTSGEMPGRVPRRDGGDTRGTKPIDRRVERGACYPRRVFDGDDDRVEVPRCDPICGFGFRGWASCCRAYVKSVWFTLPVAW